MEFFENGVWYRPDWKCVVKYIVWAFQRTFKRRKIWKIRDFVCFSKKVPFSKMAQFTQIWEICGFLPFTFHKFEKNVFFLQHKTFGASCGHVMTTDRFPWPWATTFICIVMSCDLWMSRKMTKKFPRGFSENPFLERVLAVFWLSPFTFHKFHKNLFILQYKTFETSHGITIHIPVVAPDQGNPSLVITWQHDVSNVLYRRINNFLWNLWKVKGESQNTAKTLSKKGFSENPRGNFFVIFLEI